MQLVSTYRIKIKTYNKVWKETVSAYRHAVAFFIDVALEEWDAIEPITSINYRQSAIEQLTVRTKKHPWSKYLFENANRMFVKFPSYLQRSAINEAIGKVSSYKSNFSNWQNVDKKTHGMASSVPKAGYGYPAMYRDNCFFVRTGTYTARLKVYVRNTWDWLDVELKKTNVDYIQRHCTNRKECVSTLQKRGKQWFLDFSFEEKVSLSSVSLEEQKIVAVDLGIHNTCTCSVMRADGTVLGRRFLSRENDCLHHAVNRIKKAQQHGACKTPRLWAKAKGISDDIAIKTTSFIIDTTKYYNAARYFIKEHIKSLTERKRLDILAKVPECSKRSTCTLSTLIKLYAVLVL